MNDEVKKAVESLERFLAFRDHSEDELRTKMKLRFEPTVIDEAVEYARERNLITPAGVLAERASRELSRKRKSHQYIQNQLKKRGLPGTAENREEELHKIRALVNSRFGTSRDLAYEVKTKVYRFLKYRGFEDQLIRKVLNEKNDE